MVPSYQVPVGYNDVMFMKSFIFNGHEVTIYDLSKCDLWDNRKDIIEFRCEHASVLTQNHKPTINYIKKHYGEYCDECTE